MTDTQIKPTPPTTKDDDVLHFFCECKPPKALCGTPVEEDQVVEDPPAGVPPCVVCLALVNEICPRCGA